MLNRQRPKWKVIARIFTDTGSVLLTDGTIAKTISPVSLKIGERVLIYQGKVIKFHWDDMKAGGSIVSEYPLIICFVGNLTNDYNKKFFDLYGVEISPARWRLTDDGKYNIQLTEGFVTSEDPWTYTYGLTGDGLEVPEVPCGQGITLHSGPYSARYMMNQTFEYEVFGALITTTYFDQTFNTCNPNYSLMELPYRIDEVPFMTRYTTDGILSTHPRYVNLGGVLGVYNIDGETFSDRIRTIPRLYHTEFADKTVHELIQLYDAMPGDSRDAIIIQQKAGDSLTQRVIDATQTPDGILTITEPITDRTWDLTLKTAVENSVSHRCADEESHVCYWIRGGWIGGGLGGFSGNPNTIQNTVKLPFNISEDGKLSYVSIEKTAVDFAANEPDTEDYWKTNIFIDDVAITGNAFVASTLKYHDYLQLVGGYPLSSNFRAADIRIRPLGYKVLHSKITEDFKFVLYQKYEYASDSFEFKNYSAWLDTRPVIERYGFYKVGVFTLTSRVSYWIYLNGNHIDLGYGFTQKDNQILISDELDADQGNPQPNITNNHSSAAVIPWIDIDNLTENKQLTRIFTTTTKENLLVGFDVFPVSMKHNLIREHDEGGNGGGLLAEYDEGYGVPFPPLVDSSYIEKSGRKWLLYDKNGGLRREINPPQDNRVNGLVMLHPKG